MSKSAKKPISDIKPIHLAVSGTPGSGKTTLSKRVAKILKIKYIPLIEIIMENKLYSSFDRKAKTYDVDSKVVERYLLKNLDFNESYVLDTHLAHLLSDKIIDSIIVTSCDISILNKRLKKRKYSEQKIRDNLDAEIFQFCLTEAIETNKAVEKIDCTKKLEDKKIITHLRRLHLLPRQPYL